MSKTVYLKNREPQELREIDPETQCEIIIEPRKKRRSSGGLISAMMMFSAMCYPAFESLYGGIMSPNYHKKRSLKVKGEEYYIRLNKREQKLPYEEKQDLRKLRVYLKHMNSMTDFEIVMRYILK